MDGTGTLTAASYELQGGVVNAKLGAGALSATAGSTLLSGLSAASTVTVTDGVLVLGAGDRLSDTAAVTILARLSGGLDIGAFDETVGSLIAGGMLNGSGTLTASAYDLQGATINANLGAGILTQSAGTSLLNGTAAAATVNITAGTLALGGSDRLSDTAALSISNGATLDLSGANDTVGTAFIAGTLNGAGTLTAVSYDLNGGTVNANLGAGVLNQIAGVSTLSGMAGAATVNVTGGTLTLGASERLANNAALTIASGGILNLASFDETVGTASISGTLNGAGTLNANLFALNGGVVNANLGTGTLSNASGLSTLNGTYSGVNVNVVAGALAIGASDRIADTATLAVDTGATFDLGGFNETVGLAGIAGTLAGTGTLTAAQVQLNGATVDANVAGGTLFQLGGISVLNGTVSSGAVSVDAGTLALGASDRIADTSALTIASGATFDLAAFNETVATAAIAGTLAGSGILTASQYQLDGGTVNANLGAGTLVQASGVSMLNGTAAAAIVGVNAGTLALGASDRLANNAALVIASGATLDLAAFNDTVGTASIAGTLAGTGTLNANILQLDGGTVNANLGTGTLVQASGSSLLNGTAAGNVSVNAGSLTLGASDRLADTATVVVASGASLNLGATSDTVAALGLSGTLDGTGTLSAAEYQLSGGILNANLGTGILLNTSGISTLNGTAAATSVGVNAGTLVLGASDRLANTAAVVIASGATLDLASFNDTVGTVSIAGTLAGTGTLSANILQLDGGIVNANLGTGTLVQASGSSLLNGTAAGNVSVNAGTLTLGASNRLADTATVTIATGATLNLGANNDTVGVAAIGGTLAGTGTLNASEFQLTGAAVNANLGAGNVFNLGGTSTLSGTSEASLVSVQGGTLRLGAAERLSNTAQLAINTGGTFDLANFTETAGSLSNGANGGGTLALGTGRLVLAGNADSGFSGAITGSGSIDKQGNGRLTLAGNFATTGRLDVSAGSLAFLGSSQGGARIQGGTLLGSGTFAGNLTLASGTLSPGGLGSPVQSIGSFQAQSLTVSGGNLLFDIGGQNLGNAVDSIRVTGPAVLSGGTVNVNALSATNQYLFQQQYVIVQAGSLTGTFANGTTFANVSNDAGLKWRLRYDLMPNAVVLQVQKGIDFASPVAGGSANQMAIGAALNGGAGTSSDQWAATLNTIGELSPSQRAAAYDSISGEAIADTATTTFMVNNLFLDTLNQRMGNGGDANGLAGNPMGGVRVATRNANSMASKLSAGQEAYGTGGGEGSSGALWTQAYGGYQRLLGERGQATLETSSAGVAMGAEGRLGDLVLGVAGGLTEIGADVDARNSNLDGRLYQAGGYASYDNGVSFVSVAGNYYSGRFETLRLITIGGPAQAARAHFKSDGYALSVAGGTRVDLGNGLRAVVSASATKTRDSRDGFTESAGGGLGLTVAAADRDLFTATGEVKLGQWIKTGSGYAMPYVNLGVRYNGGDLDAVGNMRFSGAPTGTGAFQVQGARMEQMVGTFGAGVDVKATERVSLGIAVENAYGRRTRESRASMRVKIGF